MAVKEEETLGHVLDEHWYYRSKGLALDAILHGRSFRALLDIGASGPLAGLVLAIPLYAWGVPHSHVIALEPKGPGLVGTTLRYPYEVRDAKKYFEDIPDLKPAPELLAGTTATQSRELRTAGCLAPMHGSAAYKVSSRQE